MAAIQTKFGELKVETAEKDSLIKSIQIQLSDAKIKLADKQAAVEKLQWVAMTSNKKVDRLQEEIDKVQGEISSFMILIQGLTRNDFDNFTEDCDFPCPVDENDDLDSEMDIKNWKQQKRLTLLLWQLQKKSRMMNLLLLLQVQDFICSHLY